MNGLTFETAEGAFQAAKFKPKKALMQQFTSLGGDAAWRLAKKLDGQKRADWMKANVDEMLEVLRAKFKDPQLKQMLLATASAYLVEHCPQGRDAFWADNGDGTGQNKLGESLMIVRGEYGGTGPVPKQ